jgi:hypothetical protein
MDDLPDSTGARYGIDPYRAPVRPPPVGAEPDVEPVVASASPPQPPPGSDGRYCAVNGRCAPKGTRALSSACWRRVPIASSKSSRDSKPW